MGEKIAKIILSIFIFIAISFGGLFVMLINLLSAGNDTYNLIIFALSATLIIFVLCQIWGVFKAKTRRIFLGLSCLLCFVIFLVNTAIGIYVSSIETITETEVNLNKYMPFSEDKEDSKTVKLDEPSTLKLNIEDELPKLDGATALYPIYSAFAQAVYPKGKYSPYLSEDSENYVVCTKTGSAYERLINGETDIIFAAKPSSQQLQAAKDKGIELKLTPIGYEAFVFFVNPKNSINGLTAQNIKDIYLGKITNWNELGGKDKGILAFQRNKGSGSQTALINFMGDAEIINPIETKRADGMGGIVKYVADYKNYSNAIGYSFLFYATEMVKENSIKLLAIDGISPTRENVANKTYPLTSEFYAVTAGTKNPNVDKLIDWILSEQGQQLIEKTGYTPIS